MPRLTGTILTLSLLRVKTTSTGFGASPGFSFLFSEPRTELVLVTARPLVSVDLFFQPFLSSGFLGVRVVTLWIGTVRTLVRERVSTSAVTDMPGRKGSFSRMRILTSNFVASCCMDDAEEEDPSEA